MAVDEMEFYLNWNSQGEVNSYRALLLHTFVYKITEYKCVPLCGMCTHQIKIPVAAA